AWVCAVWRLCAAGAEEKARRDDLGSRERNQVATAEHIGQSPLSRHEDLIARPARSPPPNCAGDADEDLCCAAQQILAHEMSLWVKSRLGQCLLHPQKRTWISRAVMSAKCQKRTSAAHLSDHLVGGSEQRCRNGEV